VENVPPLLPILPHLEPSSVPPLRRHLHLLQSSNTLLDIALLALESAPAVVTNDTNVAAEGGEAEVGVVGARETRYSEREVNMRSVASRMSISLCFRR
jgi:hypothetical protein